MQPNDPILAAGAILPTGEADEPLEAWEPDDFDHFTDLDLARVFDDNTKVLLVGADPALAELLDDWLTLESCRAVAERPYVVVDAPLRASSRVSTLNDSKVKEGLVNRGMEVVGSAPDAFAAFLKQESEVSGRLVKSAGIKVE